MRVIYRMRGLLGEATEEFIEKLGNEEEDEEEIFSRAHFVASDGGLEFILERISSVKCLTSKSRPLLDAALKLLGFCVKLKACRESLAFESPDMLGKMLSILNICIEAKESQLVEQILEIVNRVLGEAANRNTEMETGDSEELTKLLKAIDSDFVQES